MKDLNPDEQAQFEKARSAEWGSITGAKAIEVLEHHRCQDELIPIPYGAIGLDPQTVSQLVGQEVWNAAYPLVNGSQSYPPKEAELPNRVLGTLHTALNRMALDATARQAAAAEAQAAVRLAVENHSAKRARVVSEE